MHIYISIDIHIFSMAEVEMNLGIIQQDYDQKHNWISLSEKNNGYKLGQIQIIQINSESRNLQAHWLITYSLLSPKWNWVMCRHIAEPPLRSYDGEMKGLSEERWVQILVCGPSVLFEYPDGVPSWCFEIHCEA